MSPARVAAGCTHPGCPNRSVKRGKCERHAGEASGRGYGRDHGVWREMVLARDVTCVVCGSNASTIAHHVDGDQANRAMSNGQGVCRTCHEKLHGRQRW